MTTRQDDQRGSAAIEAAIGAAAFVLFLSLAILGGRAGVAHQAVQAAATDAARAASIARTSGEAAAKARTAAAATLANQQLTCTRQNVTVDTSGFAIPVGQPASVSATVTCDVIATDLGIPGRGNVRVEATMSSPLDTYRGR